MGASTYGWRSSEASATLDEYRAQVTRIVDGMLSLAEREPASLRLFLVQSLAIDPARFGQVLDAYVEAGIALMFDGIKTR